MLTFCLVVSFLAAILLLKAQITPSNWIIAKNAFNLSWAVPEFGIWCCLLQSECSVPLRKSGQISVQASWVLYKALSVLSTLPAIASKTFTKQWLPDSWFSFEYPAFISSKKHSILSNFKRENSFFPLTRMRLPPLVSSSTPKKRWHTLIALILGGVDEPSICSISR